MKTLKFKKDLVDLIIAGKKKVTWRLFDDKNLTEGDELILINSETKNEFARAKIVEAQEKKLKDLSEKDWQDHEKFNSEEEMYQAFSEFYNRKVTGDDLIKIIKFVIFN